MATDDFILDKILDKIIMIRIIEKLDEAKMLIDTDDKFFEQVTLKTVLVLWCVIKDKSKIIYKHF